MQESNFEKSVRQKLDELHLTPTEPVWQRIEAAIKKRRDRRLVFWLLPLFLLTAGLVWWQTTPPQSKSNTQQATNTHTPQAKSTFSKAHASQNKLINKAKITRPLNKLAVMNRSRSTAFTPSNKKVVIPHTPPEPGFRNQQSTQKLYKRSRTKVNTPVTRDSTDTHQLASVQTHTPTGTIGVEKKPTVVSKPDTVKTATIEKTDSIEKVLQKPIKKTNGKAPLQWSVVSHMGTSNSVEPFFSGFGAKSYNDSYPTYNTTSSYLTGAGPTSNTIFYQQPSTPARGLSLSIGALVKKPMRKRSFLVAGLQYTFYSYGLSIGTELPTDSLVQNANVLAFDARKAFRNNGTHNQFINTFHIIELPVGFEYQLLKKVPLHIQHGFTIGRLLASKALEYDYASNAYYQRSSGLRKTGFGFFTGIDYTLWKGKGVSLQAGPHMQYSLQPLFKNGSTNHLLSAGLSINMGF